MKQRIGYIDIAKAIAIAFIIIGHTGLVYSASSIQGGMPSSLECFAFTFHLPVFFIVSGYFFKLDKSLSLKSIKADAKSLLLPYFVTAALIIFACTLAAWLNPTTSGIAAMKEWAKAAIWGAGANSDVALWQTYRIGGIWFLLALFWARMLIMATSRANEFLRTTILLASMLLAIFSARYVWLPLSIQSGLGCAFYVYIGMLAKKYRLFDKNALPAFVWPIALLLWGICIIYGGRASIAMCVYPLGAIDVIGGIAACFCIVKLSQAIETLQKPSTFLQWIGRNTLVIFSLHILEDNVIPWGIWGGCLSNLTDGFFASWVILLLCRFAIDAILVAVVYTIKPMRYVYFPQSRKAKSAKA